MDALEKLPILRQGTWFYAPGCPVEVRLVKSDKTWGTGDHEDDDSIAYDQPGHCIFVLYEMAGASGRFCNVIPNFVSIESAVQYVEEKFQGITWRTHWE